MNILRIFGIVAAIHAFALLLIFANPGCSSSAAKTDPAPVVAAPAPAAPDSSPMISAPLPSAPAPSPADAAAPASGALYSPTRPGTPAAAALETQPVDGVTPAETYAVGKGDSLWSIAKKNHLRVAELAAANNLKAGATLRPGQKLLIPSKALENAPSENAPASAAPSAPSPHLASSPHPTAAARASGESFQYVVKKGETLGAIAHRFGVSTGALAAKNAISDPQKIRPGLELTIPGGGKTSSGKAAKASAGSAATASAAKTSTHSAAPAAAASAPAASPDMNAGPAPAPMPEVPVIKIDPSPAPSAAPDQPKSP